jgi:hypothetical protein
VTGLIFSAVFFPLVGLAVRRWLGGANAILAGLGAAGFVLFVTMVWRVPMIVPLILLALLAPLARFKRERTRYALLPTVLMFAVFAIQFAVAAVLPLTDYDGRAFWLLKAKAIVHEDAVDGPFFRGEGTYSPRNEYPLLVSLDAAAIWKIARSLDDRHVRWLYLLFALGFALELRRRVGPWPAAVFAWLPQIAIESEGGALSAYSDIALGAFVACAFFELVERESPLRFGMWLAFASLTKSEGLPIAVFLLVCGAFVFRKRIGAALILPAVAIAHLFIWRARIAPSDEPQYHLMLADLPRHLADLATNLGALLINIINVRDWGLVLIAAACSLFIVHRSSFRREAALAVAIIAAVILLYGAVLAVVPWPAVAVTGNIAPRLATHLLGPALYLIASAMRAREVDEAALRVDAE